MKSFLVLLVFFLFSCTRENVYFIDDSFVDLVELFDNEARMRGRDVSSALENIDIIFSELQNKVVGQCQKSGNTHAIWIDAENWQKIEATDKELLLFHELGHCVLGRGHLDSRNTNNGCESIMRSSTTVCDLVYNSLTRTEYLNELLSK